MLLAQFQKQWKDYVALYHDILKGDKIAWASILNVGDALLQFTSKDLLCLAWSTLCKLSYMRKLSLKENWSTSRIEMESQYHEVLTSSWFGQINNRIL
jgi:hypothetical protein